MKVVVFGASGTIGRPLLAELARVHDVIAVSRREQRDGGGVTWKVADAADRAAVARALEGADIAYYLVHSLGSSDFETEDIRAAETTAREAERAGLRQLVYLGGLGDDSADLSPHLRSRRETGLRLASTSVPVTTLRAAMVVGRGSAAFETIVALVDRLPAMLTPRWVSTRTQPVALADVVAYLAGVCGLEPAFGAGYDVGGPEVMTYREMIERIARLRGKHPFIFEVPVLTPYISSLLASPRDAGERRSGAAAHRRVANRNRRPGRPNPPAAADRPDLVRRRRALGARRGLTAQARSRGSGKLLAPAGTSRHARSDGERPWLWIAAISQVAVWRTTLAVGRTDPGLRRLRRQHDPAVVPAVRARNSRCAAAAASRGAEPI